MIIIRDSTKHGLKPVDHILLTKYVFIFTKTTVNKDELNSLFCPRTFYSMKISIISIQGMSTSNCVNRGRLPCVLWIIHCLFRKHMCARCHDQHPLCSRCLAGFSTAILSNDCNCVIKWTYVCYTVHVIYGLQYFTN